MKRSNLATHGGKSKNYQVHPAPLPYPQIGQRIILPGSLFSLAKPQFGHNSPSFIFTIDLLLLVKVPFLPLSFLKSLWHITSIKIKSYIEFAMFLLQRAGSFLH